METCSQRVRAAQTEEQRKRLAKSGGTTPRPLPLDLQQLEMHGRARDILGFELENPSDIRQECIGRIFVYHEFHWKKRSGRHYASAPKPRPQARASLPGNLRRHPRKER